MIRKMSLYLIDFMLVNAAFALAFFIRFEAASELDSESVFAIYRQLIIPMAVIRLSFFSFSGLYDWSFRYASLSEAMRLLASVTFGSLGLVAYAALFYFHQFPSVIGRSVLMVDFLLCLFLMLGARFSFRGLLRIQGRFQRNFNALNIRRILIIGAGHMAELLVRELNNRPDLGYLPVGFLDNDAKNKGIRIHGVQVLGTVKHLPKIARTKNINEVVIALSKASGEEIQVITKLCRDNALTCRIIPEAASLLSQNVSLSQLREVNASDLLGRVPLKADHSRFRSSFEGKVVLVTGGGGSIGSELAKMIFQTQLRELILVDFSECNLYDIQIEFQKKNSETSISTYLCDVTHRSALEKIFQKHRPDIVYHAAAHKHVPLVEQHYSEGILNNVLGSKIVADLSLCYEVERFILISSDKAIRPRSIMGVTKRIAEIYIQSLRGGPTRFISVRFGNVLNSKGSVVPLFQKQIREGGPITVTDPRVTRYFMSLSEAVYLILEATILGEGSEIFVLEMGKPVKIVKLAQDMIQLLGQNPTNIQIKYIGLRPGEKLEEEIALDGETALPTAHRKINIWKSKYEEPLEISSKIDELLSLAEYGAERAFIVAKFKEIVPEYRPWHSDEPAFVES